MLCLDELRLFKTLASAPSLAAAARALDVTPSAVTQRLQQLERRLGLRLVDRSGRGMQLTDEGELLAARSRQVLGDLAELESELAERGGAVSGRLRILAPLGFGRRYVAPAAARFRAAFPAVAVELELSDTPARDSLWDVWIHIGDLRDSALSGRKLAANPRVLCASPAYLANRGVPATPDDLKAHDCIALRENREDVTLWRLTGPDGQRATVRIDPALASNDGDVVRAWGLAGLGVILRSRWAVAGDIAAGRLVPLLAGWSPPSADVTALLGTGKARSARTDRFLDILGEEIAAAPWA